MGRVTETFALSDVAKPACRRGTLDKGDVGATARKSWSEQLRTAPRSDPRAAFVVFILLVMLYFPFLVCGFVILLRCH